MQMRVEVEVLAPGVKYGEESNLGAQVLGIARNSEEGLGGGAEEDVVYDFGIVEGNGGDRVGKGEHHMEILNGQKFGGALLKPLDARQSLTLGTVAVPAGAILHVLVLAVVAPFDNAA